MKQFYTFLAAVLLTVTTVAQVGIGTSTPHTSAALDIDSTTKGLLIPTMKEEERDKIEDAAEGLMIYQTDRTSGFYYWNGSSWSEVGAIEKTYTINTFYEELGGYVIEVRDGGKHGLVVAMQDQGKSKWTGANDLLSNPDNHDTDGAKFMDWRIPTKRELNLIYGIIYDIYSIVNSQFTINVSTSGGTYFNEKWVSITTEINGGGYQVWGQGDGTYGNGQGLIDENISLATGTYYVNCYDRFSDGWDGTLISVTANGSVIGDNGGESPDNINNNDTKPTWETPAVELEASFMINIQDTNNYWSSTERDIPYAYKQRFNDGRQDYYSKSNTYYVRAVRAF